MILQCLRVLLLIFFSTSSNGSQVFDIHHEDANLGDHHNKIIKRELLEVSKDLSKNEKCDKWHEYLEEHEHSLFGSDTPIFMAKRNEAIEDYLDPLYITYRRIPFVISDADNIKRVVPLTRMMHERKRNNQTTDLKLNPKELEDIYDRSGKSLISRNEKLEKQKSENTVLDQIYVKVLIAIDYDTFELHGYDVAMTVTYISSLLNGVDLRFRQMSDPKIRLNLAGIIIPEEPKAAAYLENYQFVKLYKVADAVLRDMKSYFTEAFPKELCDYDIAVGVVKLPLTHNSRMIKGRVEKTFDWRKELPLAVITDDGYLNSLLPLTRSIGYMLGALYDGESTKNVTGGPCLISDGYLMSNGLKNGLFWSKCSIRSMQDYLKSNNHAKEHLIKKPNVGTPMTKKLPGKLYNRNEQCKSIYPQRFVSDEEKGNDCMNLECKKCSPFYSLLRFDFFCSNITTEYSKIIPAEGSSCGVGKICLNGECVPDEF